MADEKVQINITTKGDTTGAKQVAGALGDVGRAAGKTAAESQATAKGLNDVAEASEKGAAAGRVFGEIARGNVFALSSFGAALKALGAAMRANPFTGWLVAGTALFTMLPGLLERIGLFKKKSDEAGSSIEKLTEEVKKAGEAKLDGLQKNLAGARAEAERLLDIMRLAVTLIDRSEKAEMDAALAAIDADPSLSAVERVQRKTAITTRYTQRQREREDDLRREELGTQQRGVVTAEEAALNAAREREAARRAMEAASAREGLRGSVASDRDTVTRYERFVREGGIVSPERRAEAEAARSRLETNVPALGNLPSQSELAAQAAAAKQNFETLAKNAETLREEADKAAKAFETAAAKASLEQEQAARRRAAEDNQRAAQTTAALRSAIDADNTQPAPGEADTQRRAALRQQVDDARSRGDLDAENAAQQELQRMEATQRARAQAEREYQAQLKAALAAVTDAMPPAPDPAPVRESVVQLGDKIYTFQNGMLQTVQDVAGQMQAIGQRVDAQARELQNLRIQISNMRQIN